MKLRKSARKKGQSLLESALILVLSAFMFFGLLQVVLVIEGFQIQQWATFIGGRSRIVGFNDVVVEKAWYIGNIMNAGPMLTPQKGLTSIQQIGVEQDAIPVFLQSEPPADALAPQYSYEGWKSLGTLPPATLNDQYISKGQQPYPLVIASMIPILGLSFGTTNVHSRVPLNYSNYIDLRTEATFENHFPLYLDVE